MKTYSAKEAFDVAVCQLGQHSLGQEFIDSISDRVKDLQTSGRTNKF